MTIAFTGTGGLFNRFGKLAKTLADLQSLASGSLPTDIQNTIAQYPNNNDAQYINNISAQLQSAQASVLSLASFLQSCATNTLNGMVYADNPLSSNTSVSLSIAEVIRQMKANAQYVQKATVTLASTANATNNGNGVLVGSVYRSDGLVQENAFAENIKVSCTADKVSSPSLLSRENFQALGQVAFSVFDWRYPGGSGGNVSLSAIDASTNNGAGNLLTNGSFENWTSNTPNNWTITVGTSGTQVLQSTGSFYDGASSLQLVGDGATLTALTQTFAASSGTPGTVSSQTQYAANLWAKCSAVPSSGTLELALVDGSGTVLQDVSGNIALFSVPCSGMTTGFLPYGGVFRTPYVLPSTIKLRLRLSAALPSGKNLFLDRLAIGPMTQCYTGGPSIALFSGSGSFLVNDFFTATVANDRGGSTNNKSFQILCDRFFNMRQLGYLLPSSGSPTISDALIS